jgi:hypothetical protein
MTLDANSLSLSLSLSSSFYHEARNFRPHFKVQTCIGMHACIVAAMSHKTQVPDLIFRSEE